MHKPIFLHALFCCLSSLLLPSQAHAGKEVCEKGYVWREAFVGDYVCVTPKEREQAALDNRMAASRRQPGGGAYGKDTCKQGYVWREARKGDHVCVTPQTREQNVLANRMAASRIAKSVSFSDAAAHSEADKSQTIACPLKEVRAEITSTLPNGWWQTPQQGALVSTVVERIGDEPTLVCRYRAYGGTVSVMRKYPHGARRCTPSDNGFNCY